MRPRTGVSAWLGKAALTMGMFIYNRSDPVEIDDRTLAHLRIVMMEKLRRSESFAFEVTMPGHSGRRSFWINCGVPLVLRVDSPGHAINPAWISELRSKAGGPDGLTLLPEPRPPLEALPSAQR